MSSSSKGFYPLALDVRVTDTELIVELADGRRISAPLVWFPRLLSASPSSRSHWELLGDGEGIHWPDADEDISVSGLLAGSKSDGGLISGAA
jgi:hypothetical protein